MAKNDGPARVPDGPTLTAGGSTPQSPAPDPPAATETGDEARKAKDERKGGRRPYEEILEENGLLAKRVQEMTAALAPLAAIPVDRTMKPEQAQYALSKGGKPFLLTGAHVVAAREALGMPG